MYNFNFGAGASISTACLIPGRLFLANHDHDHSTLHVAQPPPFQVILIVVPVFIDKRLCPADGGHERNTALGSSPPWHTASKNL